MIHRLGQRFFHFGLFHRIDGLVLSFHPMIERYEGKAQVRHKAGGEESKSEPPALPPRPDKAARQAQEAKV